MGGHYCLDLRNLLIAKWTAMRTALTVSRLIELKAAITTLINCWHKVLS